MFHKIQEICTKIGTRIFKIDQEMTEKIELKVATPQKVKLKMGEFEPPLKIFLFLKDEIYPLFSYSYWSKVPKWKCAHNLLCKMYKNCLKLLKIADLQPPDWIQRKKNTLYNWVHLISTFSHLRWFKTWNRKFVSTFAVRLPLFLSHVLIPLSNKGIKKALNNTFSLHS